MVVVVCGIGIVGRVVGRVVVVDHDGVRSVIVVIRHLLVGGCR